MKLSEKYSIERNYISFGKSRSGKKLIGVKFVVAHETANNTANADAHYKYFNRHPLSASAHTFIDDKKILEIIPLDEKAWHVNYDKPYDNKLFGYDANDAAIGVELCRTGSFEKAYDKYVWYHAYLCRKFNLNPHKHIVAHKTLDPKRRSDPQSWLNPNGVSWEKFINDVVKYYNEWDSNNVDEVKVINNDQRVKNKSTSVLLKKGSKGKQVEQLQKDLIKLGYDLGKYGADGIFGSITEKQVKKFQKDNGLIVDGLAGQKTLSKINELINNKTKDSKKENNKSSKKEDKIILSRLLRKGTRGNDVKAVQAKLKKLGYPVGAIDGIFGNKTENSVKLFQGDNNLKKDGIVGEKTLAKLNSIPYPGYLIKKGSRGDNVKKIQRKVGAKVDGIFGEETEQKVKSYQSKYKLQVDGIVGTETWNHMFQS